MHECTNLPQVVVNWGAGILVEALRHLGDHGIERPIIFSVAKLDAMRAEHIEPHLRDLTGRFTDLPAHVPDMAVARGLEQIYDRGARSIVAHGGGSVLDAAKAVSYRHFQATGRHIPIVALPTTLSGAEYSHYFGITETDGGTPFKRSYAVRETVPHMVLLDPVLLQNTPRTLLLSSAIKAIDHAVEGMRKVTKEHPHAIMARDGVARCLATLERWPAKIDVPEALRLGAVSTQDLTNLQLAAWHCYFTPASVIYGLSHRIGHILGGTLGLPHSATSCITLAPVIRACAGFYGDKLATFVGGDAETAAGRLADRIEHAVSRLDLASRIDAFGLSAGHLSQVQALLVQEYPAAVADLGEGAEAKLGRLLRAIW